MLWGYPQIHTRNSAQKNEEKKKRGRGKLPVAAKVVLGKKPPNFRWSAQVSQVFENECIESWVSSS